MCGFGGDVRRQCWDPKREAGTAQGAAAALLPAQGFGMMMRQAVLEAEPWAGHQGSATLGSLSAAGGRGGGGGGGGWSPWAVLCCSSRRVGGVVPVEPVLGDLRARGQDQDAALRGLAAPREGLRGPPPAGQALQYCDLPGSVLPSPHAPSSRRECQDSVRAAILAHPGMGGTAMGTWGTGVLLHWVSLLEFQVESRCCWSCRGLKTPAQAGVQPGDHRGGSSFPTHLLCLDVVGYREVTKGVGCRVCLHTGGSATSVPFLLCARSGCGGSCGASVVTGRDATSWMVSPWGPHM